MIKFKIHLKGPQSQPSTASKLKYDFPGAENIDKPGYLKAKWAKFLPVSMVKSITMNRSPGEVVKITTCFFVLIAALLHFAILALPSSISPKWVYWRPISSIPFLIGLLCCGLVFTMHRQFRGPRPNLFRVRF